jgi:hypothetical protein
MTEGTIKPEDSPAETERTIRPEDSPVHPELVVSESSHPELEEYAGGTIQARVGYIPAWLLIVYAVLFGWGLYYMSVYWGGVGPGHLQ